jgi:hypothetical protein
MSEVITHDGTDQLSEVFTDEELVQIFKEIEANEAQKSLEAAVEAKQKAEAMGITDIVYPCL